MESFIKEETINQLNKLLAKRGDLWGHLFRCPGCQQVKKCPIVEVTSEMIEGDGLEGDNPVELMLIRYYCSISCKESSSGN